MADTPLEPDVITNVLQFWKKIYDEKEVIIKFTKKSGIDRIMRCTLDFNKIPINDRPKKINVDQILKLLKKNEIVHVYDLEVKGWRSVPFSKVEYVESRKARYYIQRDEKKNDNTSRTFS